MSDTRAPNGATGQRQPKFNYLRNSACPVVFESGIREAPFSVKGTAFIVGFHWRAYVLTARHVVRDVPTERLAIFPSGSSERLPLQKRWELALDESDGDGSDLLIYRADVMGISKRSRRASHLVHLTPQGNAEWFDDRDESQFFLFGYPAVATHADYDRSLVIRNQYLIYGSYVGPGLSNDCHMMSAGNPLSLPSFDGMSGSPVFSYRTEIGVPSQPRFCGMAIRGSPSSERTHFLGAQTIVAALTAAHDGTERG